MSTSRVTAWTFVVCFAVWLMFGVVDIPIGRELNPNGLEFGLPCSRVPSFACRWWPNRDVSDRLKGAE
jgi:hypothetical protein